MRIIVEIEDKTLECTTYVERFVDGKLERNMLSGSPIEVKMQNSCQGGLLISFLDIYQVPFHHRFVRRTDLWSLENTHFDHIK